MEMTSEITVTPVQQTGGDHMVVAAARVSTSGEAALACASLPADEQAGLIRYLVKHRHGTPFEHASLTFFVRAPIFVWREWHRHRIGFSYNEESARYKPLAPVFWIPRRDRRMVPVEGWKPGRPKFRTLDEAFGDRADAVYQEEIERDREVYTLAYIHYLNSIKAGIAMEVARCKLPVGIFSSCWVTCNPRSLMAFLSLRTHEPEAAHPSYPQAEIEEAARACEQVFAAGWPITYRAFTECGRVAP